MTKKQRTRSSDHEYWQSELPCSMYIEEVETIWDAIAKDDDWQPLSRKVTAIRNMGKALRTM